MFAGLLSQVVASISLFERQVRTSQVDFIHEAENTERVAANLKNVRGVRLPKVIATQRAATDPSVGPINLFKTLHACRRAKQQTVKHSLVLGRVENAYHFDTVLHTCICVQLYTYVCFSFLVACTVNSCMRSHSCPSKIRHLHSMLSSAPVPLSRPNHLTENLAHCKVEHSKAWKRGSQRLLFLLAICLNGHPRIPD